MRISALTSSASTLAVVAVVLAGCTSTGQETSAPSGSTTTGASTTEGANPTTPTTEAPITTTAPTDGVSPSTGSGSRPPSQGQPSPKRLVLTRQGLGGVAVGASLGEFADALRSSPSPMSAADRSIFADHSCVVRQLSRFRGVGLMVIGGDPNGPVRRISIESGSDVKTDAGIGLGSSLDAVRAAYGPGLAEKFDHFPVGGDAVLVRASANAYLVFIGDDKDRVVELRLGFKPQVLSSEGCV